jgi:DNA polymerase-4
VCACVTIKVRYSDFQTKTLQRKIPYTAADHEIIPLVLELFDKVYFRRVRIRLIGVRLSHLVNGSHQINLFTDDMRHSDLYHAMDKIRTRFGDRSVMRAAGMTARTIGRSNPFNGEPPVLLANRRV